MPLILVTNDDGVFSPGVAALHEAMKNIADTVTVAPDREMSATSHSLTMHRPLFVNKIQKDVYSVNGTPTDCVTLGVSKVLERRPDLVVSGINKGGNLGDDITYSGTVSAAIEGTIIGIPSIAFSLASHEEFYFAEAAVFALKLAAIVIEKGLPRDTLLNVNIPGGKDIKGVKFTGQGRRVYLDSIHEYYDPMGKKHYWIGGGKSSWQEGDDTDFFA
ncbi:MAG: 5'/3'-nucleotidase SurE, partial [Candidatus Magnetoovum sp. WYHC-5]|nr:5'/3'-nucleotidase SurE [Candidatus Magnetoovum sp. WYHC-5]